MAGRRCQVLIWVIPLAVLLPAGMVPAAEREGGAPASLYHLALPAQPLDQGLASFAERTGVQVLYETALTRGRRAAAVEGLYSAEIALELLLRDSGLGFRRTVTDGFTLVLLAPPVPPPAPPAAVEADPGSALAAATGRFAPFLGTMQAAILAALCPVPAARPDPVRMLVVGLWIDSLGVVSGVDLARGSGDRGRDQAVVRRLRRLDLGASPPPDLPQPVTVAIGGGRDSCASEQ